MQRRGKTAQGKQRWKCIDCKTSSVKIRNDHREKKRWSLFVKWLTSKWSLEDFARQEHVTIRTLSRWFEPLWNTVPQPRPIISIPRILILDGTVLKRGSLVLLIAADGDTGEPVFWMPVIRETAESWERFLDVFYGVGVPQVIVCDAQKGLLKAIGTVFPGVLIQRCMTHVIRQAKGWLTQHPKTKTGRELLALVLRLSSIQTRRQKRKWIREFCSWKRRHHRFLKERTQALSGRSWYTHRVLRGVRSLLTNATPDLFRFIRDPSVPKTSNTVEGGLNARLKELIRCHRGTTLQGKLVLCCWYLFERQRKPPQNVY
jgi:Transposase, Mutator family